MKKTLLLLLFLSFFAFSNAFAQRHVVTGTITDADSGDPLIGASVKLKGTNVGVQADINGQFAIDAPLGSTLTISYIDYITKEVLVPETGKPNINVKLVVNKQQLAEVVVLGTYGNNKHVDNILGTASTVSGDATADKPNASIADALQGRVPGLSILSNGGEPSSLPSIRIEGLGSLTSGTDPLYVVDGIVVSANTLLAINPDDIASTEVLKDAASTSIYGARAANGVIVVTTKTGSANQPSTITVSSQYGVSSLASTSFFNDFMQAPEWKQFEVSSGILTQTALNGLLAGLPVQNANTQWYKYFYQSNVPMYQENIDVSGGGGRTSYFVSAGYLNQQGISYSSGLERWTLRSNISSHLNDWIQTGVNLGLEYDKRRTNPNLGYAATYEGGLAMLNAPIYSPYDAQGNRLTVIPGANLYDPRYLAEQQPDYTDNVTLDPTAYLVITPYKGLTLKTQAGIDASLQSSNVTTLPSAVLNNNSGSVSNALSQDVSKTFTNTLEYNFHIGNTNHFDILLGQEYQDETTSGFSASGQGLTDPRLILLSNAPSKVTAAGSEYEYALESYFARGQYDWNDKYFLEGSVRDDKSSRFGADHRSGTFYSVGASWEAKKEDFLKDVKWIDKLTLKANTGTQGNFEIGGTGNTEAADYSSLALLSGSNFYNGVGGYSISQPGDPYLTWEQQQLTTFTADMSFFNRIRLNVSYYVRKTSQEILNVPYPATSGFLNVNENTGTLENKGANITFGADLWKDPAHKGFFTLNANVDITHNKVTALFNGEKEFPQPNYLQAWVVGKPVTFYLPLYAGVNKQTGAPEWYVPGPDPSVTHKDPNDVTSTYDQEALQQNSGIGQYAPFTGGYGFSAGYMGFSVDALFNFTLGKHLLSNDNYFYENPAAFPGDGTLKNAENYWKAPGDNAEFPNPSYGPETEFDSSLLYNASFMRLKDLTLGYDFPKSIIGDGKVIKALKLFVDGRNLFTVTKYFGVDPEIDENLVYGQYPDTKQYTLGVKATF
jgi:TonB-linked SusC/RagA family outer membrane protein